jgi:hypothetical protein
MGDELSSYTQLWTKSWDSSIGAATGYNLDSRGLIPNKGKKFFFA